VTHLEGQGCVRAALAARLRRLELVLIDRAAHPARVEDLLREAEARGVPVKRVSRAELDRMTHGRTHGGVAAICGPRPLTSPAQLLDRLGDSAAPLLLLLEGVDDARNLGFTLRTADALGVDAVLLKKHLWDFDETDVSRASSGAFERIALVKFESPDLVRQLQRRGARLWGCSGRARRAIDEVDLSGPTILAVGGEKRGLSGAMRRLCDGLVSIPTRGGASLALSQAAAIALAEAARQRRRR
jgi:23S rRNA (guanosine2251-2'-O)-methyltransferase